jgi:hypothetical protein
MKASEIASRLTGISTPFGGISWTPPTPDVEVARAVLAFLEDRRVLYDPVEVEIPQHCISSVLQIREYLTKVLIKQGVSDNLSDHLRAMRAACRKFLGCFGDPSLDKQRAFYISHSLGHYNGLQDWRLNQALGQLRGVFGVHIAQIAVKYDLDVEDQLADILPPAPEDQ